MYTFAILNPRNIPAAIEANDKLFTKPVYGIEVTVPALAKRCIGNLDPQHSGGDANRAAIEDAMTAELPAEGTILATVRADLDAVGAMCILNLQAEGKSLKPAMGRINLIAVSDKFARGGWPGPKPLPTRDNPWNEETATAESSRPLAAIAAAVMDFRVSLAERVYTMLQWLFNGEEPEQYRAEVVRARVEMVLALEGGKISSKMVASRCGNTGKVRRSSFYCEHCGGDANPSYLCWDSPLIVVVESTYRAATTVGYHLAPVVVALNPEFRFQGGESHRKFTVCQFTADYVDLRSALVELAELEPGWGGSPPIGGSPQGVSSALTTDQVVEVVIRHLR